MAPQSHIIRDLWLIEPPQHHDCIADISLLHDLSKLCISSYLRVNEEGLLESSLTDIN